MVETKNEDNYKNTHTYIYIHKKFTIEINLARRKHYHVKLSFRKYEDDKRTHTLLSSTLSHTDGIFYLKSQITNRLLSYANKE